MAYLDIDFSIPIALLVAAILGVVLVRHAVSRGERHARERTRRLIERHVNGRRGHPADEMDGPRGASAP
ncbi:MAG TPA: hypothetical protein RMH99_01705 [Sandaracinaceae bacterium LLY-WYZ-13_1]|nr:hypothetical protein [Sandaracinaceae bacterium LLY-WYZ-13_1]